MTREKLQVTLQAFYQARLSNDGCKTAAFFDGDAIFEMIEGTGGGPVVTIRGKPGECHQIAKDVVAQWEWREQDISSRYLLMGLLMASVRLFIITFALPLYSQVRKLIRNYVIY